MSMAMADIVGRVLYVSGFVVKVRVNGGQRVEVG